MRRLRSLTVASALCTVLLASAASAQTTSPFAVIPLADSRSQAFLFSAPPKALVIEKTVQWTTHANSTGDAPHVVSGAPEGRTLSVDWSWTAQRRRPTNMPPTSPR